MKAIKENKAYAVVTDAEAKAYKARGFDIYDDDGNIKERASGKTVSFDDFETLKKENSALKKKIKAYEKAKQEAAKSKEL